MSGYELKDIKRNRDAPLSIVEGISLPNVVVVGAETSLSDERPVDRYNLVFIILLIHGVGTLMPWNMFINAQDYFRNYKLAQSNETISSVETEHLDDLRRNFLSYLSLASQVPNVLFNGLNLIINMGSGNLKMRVNLTLLVEALIFALTITLAVVDSTQWPVTFFYLTMISVVVLNMASGIYQNCIFGTGAKFPGSYTNAILIGSNFSGTFTSTVNLLSIWLAPKPQEAAMYYFITALLVILVCIVSYNLLPMNRFYKFFDHDIMIPRPDDQFKPEQLEDEIKQSDEIPAILRQTVDAMVPRPNEPEDRSFIGELRSKWRVFLKCWPQCLNVFLTFYVTLALFPSVLADVTQVQDYFSKKYFTSFACFFVFNVFAMIGNLISSWTTWPGRGRVWMLVVARFLFVPFFLFCNFNPKTRHWPVLIPDDIAFIIGNVVLATSSGYLSSLCMMFASNNLPASEAPKAGMLAAFSLVLGIFLGINSSLLLTRIVELG